MLSHNARLLCTFFQTALKRVQQLNYEVHRPGSIIHLDSWTIHAIRSKEESLLMLWTWFGGINFDAYRFEDVSLDKL